MTGKVLVNGDLHDLANVFYRENLSGYEGGFTQYTIGSNDLFTSNYAPNGPKPRMLDSTE